MTTENTTTTESTKAPAKKTVKKTAAKPAATGKKTAKKAPAKKAAPKAETVAEYGLERSKDMPWNDKKAAIFKALKALKATNSGSAVTAGAVAEKASTDALAITNRDVRHYCYHAKVSGLTDVVETEGTRGYTFHLTAKGAAVDVNAELKARQAAKAE